jgi:3-hydroxybutyryl-CoA dehydrogenase
MQIEKIGIVGFSNTGVNIAIAVAAAGFHTTVCLKDDKSLKSRNNSFLSALDRAEETGKLPKEEKDRIVSQVTFSTDMASLKDSNLVIETFMEDIDLKKKAIAELSKTVAAKAIIATNTECFSVTEVTRSASNPERLLGLHFFEPPQGTKLVEVIKTEKTSSEVIALAKEFCTKIGKETVVSKDGAGFIANYLFVPYMNQALEAYDHNLATKEDLDTAIRMGLGYPRGPIELIDHIGLENHLKLTSALFERTGNPRFAPPVILKRMVDSGKLGKESGEGFYPYNK